MLCEPKSRISARSRYRDLTFLSLLPLDDIVVVAILDVVTTDDATTVVASDYGSGIRLVLWLREIRFRYFYWWCW